MDIDKIELDLWAQKVIDAKNKVWWAQDYANDDPLIAICDCNIEFKKLLDNNKGDQRYTKEFNTKVNDLAEKERIAKKRAETFSLVKALDAVNKAKIELNQITTKFHNIKFSYDMKNKV